MRPALRLLASSALLGLLACSRPVERKATPGSAVATASSASPPPVAPQQPEHTVTVELSGEDVDAAWQSFEAALAPGNAPINALDIDAFGAPFGDEGVRRLLERLPSLAPEKLTLANAQLTPLGLKLLLDSAIPTRLTRLDLRDNYLGAAGARLLAESTRLTALKELNLGRCHIHTRGALALAAAQNLPGLERLELEYNFIGPDGAAALAKSTALPKLRDLGLAYNFLGNEGASQVASGKWPALALLDVGSNEIDVPGAKALAASTTLAADAFIWFGTNVEDKELERLHLQPRLKTKDFPWRDDRVMLGLADAFDRSKRPALESKAPPPEDLPSSVDFRELWIWEFGLVAEFPTFMLPGRPPGNGKSRDFQWLDRATLYIGGRWLMPDESFSTALEDWKNATAGEQVHVERRKPQTAIVRRSGGKLQQVSRVQSAHGALFYIDFSYDAELAAYFAPIAERVVQSLYFDRAHLR